MAKIKPFEQHIDRYENWFEKYESVYRSELQAIQSICEIPDNAVEIGVGSGLFAAELGIEKGIDPSPEMLTKARARDLQVQLGIAEALPWQDNSFDYALMVTTICFVDDVKEALNEAYRILKPKGNFVVGFVDQNSSLGKIYEDRKENSLFYNEAQFFSWEKVVKLCEETGFINLKTRQTVFGGLDEITEVQKPREGSGQGGFVVLRGQK